MITCSVKPFVLRCIFYPEAIITNESAGLAKDLSQRSVLSLVTKPGSPLSRANHVPEERPGVRDDYEKTGLRVSSIWPRIIRMLRTRTELIWSSSSGRYPPLRAGQVKQRQKWLIIPLIGCKVKDFLSL